jgi:hypothetical protein
MTALIEPRLAELERLDVYREALERVRPVMEGTHRTLAEAIAILNPDKEADE